MPPQQCPECGRFLKNALVAGLADATAPCPKCGLELTAAMFDAGVAAGGSSAAEQPASAAGAPSLAPVPPAPAPPAVAPSIRPPDLQPETVRDHQEALAGWDADVALPEVADRRPFPTDTVVVAAGAFAGAVAGSLALERRGRGALLGATGGALVCGIVRRVWRLPDA